MHSFSLVAGLASLALLGSASSAANNATAINSQVRLAYAGDTGMYVSWNTFEKLSNPTVKYGLTTDLNQFASSDVSVTYPTSLTYNNHVKITGLTPDTLYYYMPLDMLADPQTKGPYTFRTSRPAGDPTPYTIAVVVDLGTMGPQGLTTTAGPSVDLNNVLLPGEKNTIQSLASVVDSYDFLWHAGDIAYADYWLKEEIQGFEPNTTIADGYKVYESILNDYYDEMTPITTLKPYMVGPGNHESNCDNGGYSDDAHNITYDVTICMPGQTNFTGFINHFRMPSDESGGTGNFWYSFDHGMVHYVQFNTETDLGHGFIGNDEVGGFEGDASGPFNQVMNAQTTWLEKDLAAVDRTKTPWVIAAGHRPWYLSADNTSDTICWTCKDVFEPLFIKYNVDLVISGHQHAYERQAPLANGLIDPNELNNPSYPWYIMNGAAGHYDGLDPLNNPFQKYHRFGLDITNATYGWSRLTFHNCTHMTHDFVNSSSGAVLDTATLYKNRSCNLGKYMNSTVTASSSTVSSTVGGSQTGSSKTGGSVTGSSMTGGSKTGGSMTMSTPAQGASNGATSTVTVIACPPSSTASQSAKGTTSGASSFLATQAATTGTTSPNVTHSTSSSTTTSKPLQVTSSASEMGKSMLSLCVASFMMMLML